VPGFAKAQCHRGGAEILEKSQEQGFVGDRLFIDPITLAIKVPDARQQPGNILAAIEQIRLLADPVPHIVVGLSNLARGVWERILIKRTFLGMAISHGLDSAIIDVLDEQLMDVLATAEMLMNKQIDSDSYVRAYRAAQSERFWFLERGRFVVS